MDRFFSLGTHLERIKTAELCGPYLDRSPFRPNRGLGIISTEISSTLFDATKALVESADDNPQLLAVADELLRSLEVLIYGRRRVEKRDGLKSWSTIFSSA